MYETLLYSDLGIVLYSLSSTISISYGLILWNKKKRTFPQTLLSITLLMYSLSLLLYFVFDRYIYPYHYEILRMLDSLVTAPVVIASFFYFTMLLNPRRINRKFLLYNIIPFLLLVFISFIAQVSYGRIPDLQNMDDFIKHLYSPTVIIRIVLFVYLIGYETYITWTTTQMYFNYRRFIRDNYSFRKDIDLQWIPAILITFFSLGIFGLFCIASSSLLLKILFGFLSIILISIIFYFGSKQGDIPVPENGFASSAGYNIKNNGLKERLLKYFEEEKPYLNKDLKMQDLAYALYTNRSYISQLLNKEFNSSFYSFVNYYRIGYTLEMMKKKPGMTIEHYADAAGFKSRSVFFSQFKEIKGCTPSYYLSMKRNGHPDQSFFHPKISGKNHGLKPHNHHRKHDGIFQGIVHFLKKESRIKSIQVKDAWADSDSSDEQSFSGREPTARLTLLYETCQRLHTAA